MKIILVLLIIVVLLPGIAVWAVSKFVPKLLWSVPVVTLIITGLLLLKDIISFSSEPAFTEKIGNYTLHNDSSMGLYLIYLPVSIKCNIDCHCISGQACSKKIPPLTENLRKVIP